MQFDNDEEVNYYIAGMQGNFEELTSGVEECEYGRELCVSGDFGRYEGAGGLFDVSDFSWVVGVKFRLASLLLVVLVCFNTVEASIVWLVKLRRRLEAEVKRMMNSRRGKGSVKKEKRLMKIVGRRMNRSFR